MIEKEWHIMNVEEVIKELQTSLDGLTTEQFKYRQGQYGLNKLKEYKKTSPLKIFFKQFTDFLIIILLIATIVSAFIGEFIDAIVILTIVLACALLGFFQEYRSEKAVEALKKLSTPKATVIRNSEEQEIPAEELVPGDLIIVRVGDKVPADARLIEEMNLETDEAVLTGESVPVKKEVSPVLEKGIPIADRKCMIYAGTTVTHGHGKAVVTETGMETEFGKIAKMIQSIETEKTPLEIRLEHIGKWLGFACLVVCALASVSGILRGYDYLDMFIWGISLAVAAVPEALPAVVTGALSIGVQRMAKNNAIVKRLPAVETLGCTSVICSDKTGTLTKNEMTVKKIYVNRKTISVTGTGYEPKGKFFHKGKRCDPEKDPHISLLFKIGLLCNDASLRQENGIWKVHGDPTEGALVVVAAKAGFDQESIKEKHPRVGEISFDMIRKRMTTIHPKSEKKQIAYVKGAPELMLNLCTKIYERGRIRKMTPKKKEEILELTKRMASKALRILAFAYREIPVMDKEEYTPENVENNLIFVGLMGMIDPPRKEAISAIRSCTRAGIRPVIVTGDHAITAFAIAKEIKLIKPGEKMTKDILITGPELDELSDEDLERVVDKIKIYARVNPHHKLRIIEALKKKGVIVAMTGDGINDAPALRKADIGISMGITGTDVTKEASDMILADDNFVTIVKAVKEGRAIYDNIKKYLLYLLQCNIGEILVLALSFFIGLPPPLIAIQILWVNLATDGLPALALGIDPPEPDLMKQPPRKPKQSVFTKRIIAMIVVLALTMAMILLPEFYWYLKHEGLDKARTMLFVTMILFEIFNAFNSRSDKHSLFKIGVFSNRWLNLAVLSSLLLMIILIQVPALNSLFHMTSLNFSDWVVAVLASSITLGVGEGWKWMVRKKW